VSSKHKALSLNPSTIGKKIQRINETKSWFFEKINMTDKSLAILTKRKRKPKLIKYEKGAITTNTTEIQGIIREYFRNSYFNKLEQSIVSKTALY
jgi:hypothetical protein